MAKTKGPNKVNKRFWPLILGIALIVPLGGCAKQQTYPLEAYQPVRFNPSAHTKQFDTFVVVLDTASSMDRSYRKRLEADHAREIVERMNRMIPALDYRANLVAFSSGSCLSCEDAVVLYGPAPYNRDEFAAALADYATAARAGRLSAMGGGTTASNAILQDNPGRMALIVVNDSENILHGRAFKTVQKLRATLGGGLCLYPIQVDRDSDGRRVMDELVNVGGCGFSVHVDDIAAPDAMAGYVARVFLAPSMAPLSAAPADTTMEEFAKNAKDRLTTANR
jgi:hypothetical protein